jgi:hypothetical protein
MSRQITVLIAGLTMEASKRMNPAMDTIKFGKALQSSMDTLHSVPGIYHKVFWLDPIAADDAEISTNSLKKLIRQGPPQGGQWDAYLIGGGLKMIAPLTPLFEDIINTIITSNAGKPKILFSANGMDHWEVAKRGFPELGMGERPAATES